MAGPVVEASTEPVSVVVDGAAPKTAAPQTDYNVDAIGELAVKLGTSLDPANPGASYGLTAEEAALRLARDGPNMLIEPQRDPEWLKFARQFKDRLLLLLILAGILAFIAYGIDTEKIDGYSNAVLGACLFCVVFASGCMTYAQERATAKVLAQIHSLLAATCVVVRGGKDSRIEASTLVVGDVVRLSLGDRVPADLRIIAASELRTERSGVTGESAPVKAVAAADAAGTPPLQSRALVFNSSLCVIGEGVGVVIRTGNRTVIGSIASLASDTAGAVETLLQKEVKRFVWFIAVFAALSACAFFTIGISRAAVVYHPNIPKAAVLSAFINGFVVLLVAFVPEGLPATLTSLLAITAKRMAQRNVLVKRLDIVESLGCATCIATDKTGTLTQNVMTVEHLWYNRNVFYAAHGPHILEQMAAVHKQSAARGDVLDDAELEERPPPLQFSMTAQSLDGDRRGGQDMAGINEVTEAADNTFTLSGPSPALRSKYGAPPWRRFSPHAKLLAISALCNRARPAAEPTEGALSPVQNDKKAVHGAAEHVILGGAADAALFRYSELFFSVASSRAQFPSVFDVPFSSAAKWSGVVCKDRADPSCDIILVKGAPEVILRRCSVYAYHQAERAIDDAFREEFTHAYERFGSLGERVLGFAYAMVPPASKETYQADPRRVAETPLVFVGLVSLVDPPRAGVAEAISTCRSAGIKVIMVTGDHPLTAEAIARKVGIVTRSTVHDVAAARGVAVDHVSMVEDPEVEAPVITGEQLNELNEHQWALLLAKPEVVLARTSPHQKLKLVEHLQVAGHIVAATGDGVNDSPALKRAQIGVAMGSQNASDVAREAADIILLDDNFASIVNAIEEGRTLFENLRKTIVYTLAHTMTEVFPALLNLAFGLPLPLNGLLILTIDLLTEQGPAISLAFETSEHAVMARPPRDLKRDRLVKPQTLIYAYGVAGLTITATCFFAYTLAFTTRGVSLSQLGFSTDNTAFWAPPPRRGTSFDSEVFNASRYANDHEYVHTLTPRHHFLPAAFVASHDGQRIYPPLWVNRDGGVLDARQQWSIYRQAQSAWYLTLILCQFWHIWNCRTRVESIFSRLWLLSNPATIYGCVAAVAIACFVIFLPAFHSPQAFQSASVKPVLWTPQFAFAAFITVYNELVKRTVRRRPISWVARNLQW
jgi:sodium/potassium-transporting ATPase subunit alpha